MIKKFLLLFILLGLIINVYLFQEYTLAIKGFKNSEKVNLTIEYGTPVKKYVKILQEKGIIKNELAMLVYLKWYNQTNVLQAGNFTITKGTPIPKLVKVLSNAKTKEISIKILEGYTIDDINKVLTDLELINSNEFINCIQECDFSKFSFIQNNQLEGYLFPDTYFIDPTKFNVKMFIERLLKEFEKRVLTNKNISIYTAQKKSLKDIIIMASIIEKEERTTKNMPIVAGILWKRLNEKIHLGADATTRYYEKNSTGVLTKADFLKDNKYNTRLYLGLPPTPICSPGEKAIEAALSPVKSKYYYYLHDSNGIIHYAITNEQHNQNKFKYIK